MEKKRINMYLNYKHFMYKIDVKYTYMTEIITIIIKIKVEGMKKKIYVDEYRIENV